MRNSLITFNAFEGAESSSRIRATTLFTFPSMTGKTSLKAIDLTAA